MPLTRRTFLATSGAAVATGSKELHDRGVRSVEALADQTLVGRKAVVAGTAIGSGTYGYGVYVFGGPIPVTVGYALRETLDRSPDLVAAYVNATYKAQQWIRKAKDDEIVDLLGSSSGANRGAGSGT
jgi:ABC-type nitrate/sulfonate/bicarbonate transport system substrate-binding protein